MKELVDRKVDVIVTYSTAAGIAAKKATSTVPVVNGAMLDPVRDGLVASLARPAGNLTGISWAWSEGFGGKLLELLQEMVPKLSTVALITNPNNPAERALTEEVVSAAEGPRLKLKVIPLRDAEALQAALKQARQEAQALMILGDPVLYQRRREIISFASQHSLPAIYGMRDFAADGAYSGPTGDTTTVSVENENVNPSDFYLYQNYPNPFNPTTKIKFNIPSVTLRQAQSDICNGFVKSLRCTWQ